MGGQLRSGSPGIFGGRGEVRGRGLSVVKVPRGRFPRSEMMQPKPVGPSMTLARVTVLGGVMSVWMIRPARGIW